MRHDGPDVVAPALAARGTGVVSAVVISYQSECTITACIKGLIGGGVDTVTVVDNSIDDATEHAVLSMPESSTGQISYHRLTNVGYARAVNYGVRESRPAQWLVVANADVELRSSLDRLIAVLEAHEAAMVSGLLSGVETNIRPKVTPLRELYRAVAGDRRAYGRLRGQVRGPHPVPQLDGALLVMPTDIFEALEGFDERFELYYEDVDLCVRSLPFGGCWLVPEVVGHHIGGSSTTVNRAPSFAAMRVSRLRYARKHWGRGGVALVVLAGVLETCTRSIASCSEGWEGRKLAISAQVGELKEPGVVWLFPGNRQMDREDT